MQVLFVFQRLDERTAHRRFGWPERGEERRGEHHWHDRQRDADWKLVVQPHAGDILTDDLQRVVKIDRTERIAECEAERRGAEGFHPNRPSNLIVGPPDSTQHAELSGGPTIRFAGRVGWK